MCRGAGPRVVHACRFRGGLPWLSVDDEAAHRGITKDTVCTWIAEKEMPADKPRRLWRFRASDADG